MEVPRSCIVNTAFSHRVKKVSDMRFLLAAIISFCCLASGSALAQARGQ
jgi:hypothetical protein